MLPNNPSKIWHSILLYREKQIYDGFVSQFRQVDDNKDNFFFR